MMTRIILIKKKIFICERSLCTSKLSGGAQQNNTYKVPGMVNVLKDDNIQNWFCFCRCWHKQESILFLNQFVKYLTSASRTIITADMFVYKLKFSTEKKNQIILNLKYNLSTNNIPYRRKILGRLFWSFIWSRSKIVVNS